jgi:hypothetical protein
MDQELKTQFPSPFRVFTTSKQIPSNKDMELLIEPSFNETNLSQIVFAKTM